MTTTGADRGRSAAGVVTAALVLLIVCGVFVPHARAYFFLFDDFALVGQAGSTSVRDILTQPLFGFYRPAGFLLTRAEFQAFGGWSPMAFAASALVLHAINAALAGLLAQRLRLSTLFALSTASLFLLSPWAGETFFWSSARFDLLATFGVLLALWLGDMATDRDRAQSSRLLCVGGAALASALALLSKEAAVVLPLLFIVYAAMKPAAVRRDEWRWRAAAAALAAAAVGLYLWRRQALLPGLTGAYGSFGTLLAQGHLALNFGNYARALVLLPMPGDWSLASVALALAGKWLFLAISLPVLLFSVLRGACRHMAWCAAGFVVSLIPAAWIGIMPGSTASGRLMYLPGLFFALLLARGLHEWFAVSPSSSSSSTSSPAVVPTRVDARSAAAWLALIVVPIIYFAGSLHHQQRMWGVSAALARSAMQQFEPLVGSTRPVVIANLPFWFAEGPFVLKGYAFQQYYAPRPVPPVRAMASALAFGPGGTRDVRELARVEEPGAAPGVPQPDEVTMTFSLPIRPAPGAILGVTR